MIFVFGSNLAGRHGQGAALYARNNCGAEYGVGIGRTGNAFAIPTKDERIRTLPLDSIRVYVNGFIAYAKANPDLEFQVTKIGCGLAGYQESDIAPMFKDSPENCHLPDGWRSV
ncbi:MAG: A1S_2505 family phage non-structural protein [Endozoicomonas sp.]